MKQLETQFTNDNHNFTQVKRSDKAALYKRETLEGGFVSYEVFAIMTKNGAEIYPNQAAMSHWAWCPINEARANVYFDRINSGEVVIPQVDPETGEALETDNRSLDELPDVNVDTNTVSVEDPTAPEPAPKVELTKDGGAVVVVAKVAKVVNYTYPTGEFTQAQFATANGMPVRGVVWSVLDKLVKGGKLTKELRQLNPKGRPTQIFTEIKS